MFAVEQGREALVPARKERGHEFGVVRLEAGDVDGHLLAVTLPLEPHVARTAIACNVMIQQSRECLWRAHMRTRVWHNNVPGWQG